MNKTERELGREEGVQTGHQQGHREAIAELIQDYFGALPEAAQNRIFTMDRQELAKIRMKIRSAKTLKDLGLE